MCSRGHWLSLKVLKSPPPNGAQCVRAQVLPSEEASHARVHVTQQQQRRVISAVVFHTRTESRQSEKAAGKTEDRRKKKAEAGVGKEPHTEQQVDGQRQSRR